MRYVVLGLLLCGAVLAFAQPVQAQWLAGIYQNSKQHFWQNNSWPKPYVYMDREAVVMPFATMTNNGWRRQNMICDYHFEEDTAKLTKAGEGKLYWILTQTPPQRRTIFVQSSAQPDMTAARLDSIQQASLAVLPQGVLPQIVQTNLATPGRAGQEIDDTYRLYENSPPVPRLPGRSTGASSGTSSASSGGATTGSSSSSSSGR